MDKPQDYISQEQQEEFERFLMGQMVLDEETNFLQKLQSDSALKNQFEEFKALFFDIEEASLRNVLHDFHKTIPEAKPAKSKFYTYSIAASLATIIALCIWFFNQPNQNEKLFNQHFTPDPGLPTVMGTHDNYAFYEAMVDYKQAHYGIAIEKWSQLHSAKPNNDTLNYFLGAAYLAQGDSQNAIDFLERSLEEEQGFFKEDALFLLGLAYVKADKVDLALKKLRQAKTDKSKKLVEELEK